MSGRGKGGARVWAKGALSATAKSCATTYRASLSPPSAAWPGAEE
ncbi:rCG45193 [Rattus norvegicus]|uniref:RCG45193 n=1 Tax=Rattus norvegicus TaxID=10116 RepID=A6KLP5_RAT|nr:rCG45193 [Rattus norvegicus]